MPKNAKTQIKKSTSIKKKSGSKATSIKKKSGSKATSIKKKLAPISKVLNAINYKSMRPNTISNLYSNVKCRPELIDNITRRLSYGLDVQSIINIVETHCDQDDLTITNKLRESVTTKSNLYETKQNLRRGESRWKMIKYEVPKNVQGMLDYGGNVGDIAYVIGRNKLQLSREKTIVVDINEWSGQKWTPRDDINFIHFNSMNTIPDNSVDLITSFHVMHHVEEHHLPKIVSELARILSPSGVFILYEHDCTNRFMVDLIDLIHMLYDVVMTQIMTYKEFAETHYAKYKSIKGWIKLFESHFKVKKIKYLNNSDHSAYITFTVSKYL
jgi:ubiquinone/menaquinone biosynthesis C-methylase UbiE